jgi:creatinine amidohydrolase
LPYGTDTFEADAIAERACEVAWNQGAKVVMLPTIPYGTETNMASCALAMNVNPSTLGLVIRDLVQSLEGNGIRKLLILNGHGGNDFKPLVRELMVETSVKLFLVDWFRGLTADVQKDIFDDPGDHAGEMETSMGLAFFDDLVLKNPDGTLVADDGAARPSRFQAINEGWVGISRPWHLLTTNTGCGDPHPATAEKGTRLMDVMVDRLSGFLIELAKSEIDEEFPY